MVDHAPGTLALSAACLVLIQGYARWAFSNSSVTYFGADLGMQ